MNLAERFRDAVGSACQREADSAELVPMFLSRACVDVLPVAGAGISITDDLRVPLGASDETVARAERLQTTLGEGPCLDAVKLGHPLVADLETIAGGWPMFHRRLLTETPFRSIASFPLIARHSSVRFGALDLYFTEAEAVPSFFVDNINATIAGTIADVLFGAPGRSGGFESLPPWLSNHSVTRRMQVWIAVGILIEHAGLDNADALAALRGYAFSHDISLDDVAGQLMSEAIRPESVLA